MHKISKKQKTEIKKNIVMEGRDVGKQNKPTTGVHPVFVKQSFFSSALFLYLYSVNIFVCEIYKYTNAINNSYKKFKVLVTKV
jgi:hypothetical protein